MFTKTNSFDCQLATYTTAVAVLSNRKEIKDNSVFQGLSYVYGWVMTGKWGYNPGMRLILKWAKTVNFWIIFLANNTV